MTAKTIVKSKTPGGFLAIDGRFSLAGRPQRREPPLFAAQPLSKDVKLLQRRGTRRTRRSRIDLWSSK